MKQSRPRLKKVSFVGSSNRLRGRALQRVQLEQTVRPFIFNFVTVGTSFGTGRGAP